MRRTAARCRTERGVTSVSPARFDPVGDRCSELAECKDGSTGEQFRLVGEVVVGRRFGHADAFRDGPDGHGLQACFADEVDGGVEQRRT